MDWYENTVKLLVCMLEVYLMFDFFLSLAPVKDGMGKKWSALICICTTLLLFIINMWDNAYVNFIGFPLLFWIFLSLLFDMKLGRRIFYFLIAYSINVVCEFLYVIWIRLSTRGISAEGLPLLTDNILQLITIKFMTFIAYNIVKRFSAKHGNHMSNKIFALYLCLPVSTLGMLITIYYSGVNFTNFSQRVFMTVFLLLMLLANIFIYYAYNKYAEELYENSRREMIIIKQKSELEYMQESIWNREKHQELIHDTSNYINTIKQLMASGENERASGLLSELNEELEKNVMIHLCDNMALNALLSEKASAAERQNVDFDIYVEPNLEFGPIKDIDLVSMLGNLIDNAIRGAAECKENREVWLRIFMQNEGNVLVVKIENACSETIVEKDGELQSTKMEQGVHGLGIKSVRHSAEKYDGYLNIFIENRIFTAILLLPV